MVTDCRNGTEEGFLAHRLIECHMGEDCQRQQTKVQEESVKAESISSACLRKGNTIQAKP